MRQKDREKEKKGRERRKRKKRRKKGRKRHSLLSEGLKQLSEWETGERQAHSPWGQSTSLREQAQELVSVTFRLACWLPDSLCQSVENHTAQSLFHQPFGFLGAGPMSPDALQGQMTCQLYECGSQKHHPEKPGWCCLCWQLGCVLCSGNLRDSVYHHPLNKHVHCRETGDIPTILSGKRTL